MANCIKQHAVSHNSWSGRSRQSASQLRNKLRCQNSKQTRHHARAGARSSGICYIALMSATQSVGNYSS